MSKRLIVLLALAFVVGLAAAAYAEVQNVKVSGDITAMGISRDNFNLNEAAGNAYDDQETALLSQVRLKVDADLTDNVSATMRLINERSWDTETQASSDIDLDLAYVTLKEFLYSPLSLKIGRQELIFGNQLIIGTSVDYNANVLNGVPSDLSLRKAFDAIRATFNYDPLVVDAVYAKIDENTATLSDDVDLYGINAKYDIDSKTSVEGYLWIRHDDNDQATAGTSSSGDKATKDYVFGGLVSMSPIDNLKASLEAAYQLSTNQRINGSLGAGNNKNDAWAFQPMLSYDLKTKFSPNLGLRYTYLSGDWNPMYYGQALNNIVAAIIPFSNLQAVNVMGSIKPADDITLKANYGWYQRTRETETLTAPKTGVDGAAYGTYAMRSEKELGSAFDLTATYDYTEDVQFGLTTGMFIPGRAFNGDNDNAVQVIGSMKVTF